MAALASPPDAPLGALAPRREFLQHIGAWGAAALAAPALQACRHSQAQNLSPEKLAFLHGVASGDPGRDSVVLWTRVTPLQALEPGQEIWLDWRIARDPEMLQLAGSGSVATSAAQDFTVKLEALGLQPGQTYYYSFSAPAQGAQAARHSPRGRTRTLPAHDVAQVKLAVLSCSNFPAGYFNVYQDCARQTELDAVLHLGDYIYEYGADGYASARAEQLGRVAAPAHELQSLEDYRQRYAQYRSDPDLQALHAAAPFICIWDDHEFADDTWRDGAQEHDNGSQGPFALRRAAAAQAWQEWLPVRTPDMDKIWRSFDFGGLLSLYMLDTRLAGRDQQLQFASYVNAQGKLDLARLRRDARAARRRMLGREQFEWLQSRLQNSSARWQVLGQQVLMARMEFPLSVACGEQDRLDWWRDVQQAQRDGASVKAHALLHAPRAPCYLDSWDGYQAERERLYSLMQGHGKNLISLAGDTHNAWASDLQDEAGRAVGVEFATASVSSPGLESSYQESAALAACMQAMLPTLRYAQTSLRGYMLLTVSAHEAECAWRFVDTVHTRQFSAHTGKVLRVLHGQGKISPAAGQDAIS
ncbi:alkaline phosphatase D family protein [Massilia sp. W12]|uniref:alkaline phosphatase D family protein n=1 Tax=Massilia sp. W12 TaxID=3126507 RepID=UPI0030CF960D